MKNNCKRRKKSRCEASLVVHAVLKDPPDLAKLSRALIRIAMAEMEAEKQAAQSEADNALVSKGGETNA